MNYLPFIIALAISLILTPIVRNLSTRFSQVVDPRTERWHKTPTPTSGGIAIFIAFFVSSIISPIEHLATWGLLLGAGLAFVLGLIDDIWAVSPPTKLIGQLMAASIIVLSGNVTAFFSSEIVNIVITLFWLVAISNALNLLDNMDGLASGTTLVVAGFLAYFFLQSNNSELFPLAIGVGGAILGFLVFNFPPASIFMGDSGSLFLGILLAGLAIAREPQASNVFAILSVPVLILLLPILDTSMVSLTRLLRGQSPAVGGKDHMSHRLVSLGFSERQVLILLLSISIVAGIAAVLLESLSYDIRLVLIPILIIALALFTAYLGQIKFEQSTKVGKMKIDIRKLMGFASRLHFFEVLLDFFLIAFAYFLAFVYRFGYPLSNSNISLYLYSLPIVMSAAFASIMINHVYQSVWRYLSFRELVKYAQAAVLASVGAAFGIVLFFRFEDYSRQVFLFFPALLFILLTISRFSFRLLESLFGATRVSTGTPILIYGAGDAGEFAIREIIRNNSLNFKAVGFIDDKENLHGREIHGVRVLGGITSIEELIKKTGAKGMIISTRKIDPRSSKVLALAKSTISGFWVKRLRIEFDDVD
jgi:UDP-GlcNAc:undecaprenyl-phosphate GlcNAc-1-phosphate transferase